MKPIIFLNILIAVSLFTGSQSHAKKLSACKNFTTQEQYRKDNLESFGIHLQYDGNKRSTKIGEISSDFSNEADLRVGDQIVHINGQPSPSLPAMFCGGRVSALTMIKRDEEYFEVVLTIKKAVPLKKLSVDFPATNPFKWNRNSNTGRRTKPVFASPTLAALFEGDFSKFDRNERTLLIVYINSAVSRVSKNFANTDISEGLKFIFGKNASRCFPYGSTKIEYDTFVEKRDLYGNTISRYKSRFSGRPILFDPTFSEIMYAKWKDGLGAEAYREMFALINENNYGCNSIEYRMLYNRLFTL